MNDFDDSYFMRIALKEAKKGLGKTSPNPCVGAVIVRDGKVLSKGYHRKAGTPHAEINALRGMEEDPSGATMYVTLEPCNHHGKTPPCSHAVAEAGIKRVVIGMEDPNPLVDGSGIDYLKDNGVEITVGVLEEQCQAINLPFIKKITTGLPLLVMKAGISLDGRLNYQVGAGGKITGEESSKAVHRLRSTYDAILVGSNTLNIDDPSLTTRLPGKKGKDPVRVILDRTLSLAETAKVLTLDSDAPTWIFCSNECDKEKVANLERTAGVRVFRLSCNDSRLDLHQLVKTLGQNGISSVLVEGGGTIHGSFLREKLYDYAQLFVAPVFAGDSGVPVVTGVTAKSKDGAISIRNVTYKRHGDDIMISGKISYPKT